MPDKSDHDMLVEIHTVLLGTDGEDGLCARFKALSEQVRYLDRRFWLLVGTLAGSGVIAGSWFGLK